MTNNDNDTEAARETAARRREAEQQAERNRAFTETWGTLIADTAKRLAPYLVDEITGYPAWGRSGAIEPHIAITGDAAILAWIVVRLADSEPDAANTTLPIRAPWLRPIFQMSTGQPVTPTGSIETVTVAGAPVLTAVIGVAATVDADPALAALAGPPPPPQPGPYTGVLRKAT